MNMAVRHLLYSVPTGYQPAASWHWHAGEPYVCHWDSIQYCGKVRAALEARIIWEKD